MTTAFRRLTIALGEFRLRVVRIDMRDAAVHEQEDDALGLGLKMYKRLQFFGSHRALSKQSRHCQPAEAEAGEL
jgi:hypothetical protein